MKNIIKFYSAILVPIGILVWLNRADKLKSEVFVFLLLIYILVYRTFTDGMRLYEKGIIQKEDIWKTVLFGYHFKYFKQLYFK